MSKVLFFLSLCLFSFALLPASCPPVENEDDEGLNVEEFKDEALSSEKFKDEELKDEGVATEEINDGGLTAEEPEDEEFKEGFIVSSKDILGPPWCNSTRAYIDHVEGRWLTVRQGYSSIGVFSPLARGEGHRLIPFLDMRGHVFNDGKVAANLGGGLRYLLTSGETALGMNAYYDFRRVPQGSNHYQQVGVGLELLTSCWDIRANGYFPIGKQFKKSTHRFDNFIGDFSATCTQRRPALWGGDLEIGQWLCPCNCGGFEFYGAVGLYAYSPRGKQSKLVGGQARFLAFLTPNISLEIKGGYDRIFHGMIQGRITLMIPLQSLCCMQNCSDLCGCLEKCFLYQPVQRQEIIQLGGVSGCCWKWNWDTSSSSSSH